MNMNLITLLSLALTFYGFSYLDLDFSCEDTRCESEEGNCWKTHLEDVVDWLVNWLMEFGLEWSCLGIDGITTKFWTRLDEWIYNDVSCRACSCRRDNSHPSIDQSNTRNGQVILHTFHPAPSSSSSSSPHLHLQLLQITSHDCYISSLHDGGGLISFALLFACFRISIITNIPREDPE